MAKDSFIYISPCELSVNRNNPFKNENRKYPIEFTNLLERNFVFNFQVPDGYRVIEIPKSQLFSTNTENDIKFEFKCNENKGNITIRSKLKFNKYEFTKDQYKGLQELYDLIVKKHNEQIVIKKT
jgi:hypothetical protein